MREQSFKERLADANGRQRLHQSETTDLLEHMFEVRDLAKVAGLPFDVVAGLSPYIYAALMRHFDREFRELRVELVAVAGERRKSNR